MAHRAIRHLRSNTIAYLALFLALGGGAYAASKINGGKIRKSSIPGNRLKPNSVTGKQVKVSKLGTVPKATLAHTATNAGHATEADHAASADNANAVGGVGTSGFGRGIVSGLMFDPRDGSNQYPPFGIYDVDNANPASIGVAPADFTIRDVTLLATGPFSVGKSLDVSMTVTSGPSSTTTHLCNLAAGSDLCNVAGPVAVPKNA